MNWNAGQDHDVHACLDGELAPAEQTRFEQRAAADPVLGEMLAAYRRVGRRLHAEFDPVIDEAVPPAMLAAVFAESPARRRHWPAIAASLAMFVLGAGGGWYLNDATGGIEKAGSPAALAIAAHRVFAAEIRHPVEVGADQRDHLVAWLSNRLGQPLNAPDFSDAGFQLVGGRLLPGEASPAAQLMYENPARERVTLYFSRNLSGGQTAFRLNAAGELRSFFWLDGPFGYVITGSIAEPDLLGLAHSAFNQLSRSDQPAPARRT